MPGTRKTRLLSRKLDHARRCLLQTQVDSTISGLATTAALVLPA
jgi:hypothetical protein